MKVTISHITNSSSSSFLVVYDSFPKDVKEMQKLLFADRLEFPHPYDDDKFFLTETIASIVLIETHTPTEDELMDFFRERTDVDLENYKLPEYKYNWDAYRRDCEAKARESMKRFLDSHKGKALSIYEYSDDTALGSSMEHGNLFRRVEHIRVSKH